MLTRTETNKLIAKSVAFVTTTVETVVCINAKLVALVNVPIQALIHTSWNASPVHYNVKSHLFILSLTDYICCVYMRLRCPRIYDEYLQKPPVFGHKREATCSTKFCNSNIWLTWKNREDCPAICWRVPWSIWLPIAIGMIHLLLTSCLQTKQLRSNFHQNWKHWYRNSCLPLCIGIIF